MQAVASRHTTVTIQATFATLPMSGVTTAVFIVLYFVFLATTLDHAVHALALITSKDLSGSLMRWLKATCKNPGNHEHVTASQAPR